MRSQHKMRSRQWCANLFLSPNLYRITTQWLSSRMRVWRRVWLARILQQMEVWESLLTVWYWSFVHKSQQPSRRLRMSEELLGIAFHRMPSRMLRRRWLPGIATSLLLWNLQEPLRWRLRCKRWLQSPWINSDLFLPSWHDGRSFHQLSQVCPRRLVPTKPLWNKRNLHAWIRQNSTRTSSLHMSARLHRKRTHKLR